MSISVTQVIRRTGETIYTVRDDTTHRRVATVTSDGIFDPDPERFHGYVQDWLGIRDPKSEFGRAALAAVDHYVTWARTHGMEH